MNRPASVWLIFAFCVSILLAATGWVSVTVLQLDRAQFETRLRAQNEENVRLALWRMDSFLTPLIVEEGGRPYFHYTTFHAPERAYSKGYVRLEDVLVPSPLLAHSSSNVLIHFQLDLEGNISSPQVPAGKERSLALTHYTNEERLAASEQRLAELRSILNASAIIDGQTDAEPPIIHRDLLVGACSPVPTNTVPRIVLNQAEIERREQMLNQLQRRQREPPESTIQLKASEVSSQAAEVQVLRNTFEKSARDSVYQNAALNDIATNPYLLPRKDKLVAGPVKPVWVGTALILSRRVAVEGRDLIQGAWLNWDSLNAALLGMVDDLVPGARLEPVPLPVDPTDTRILAALPVRLAKDYAAPAGTVQPTWTPVRVSLAIVWACVFIAAIAVAALLHGALSLSERRGAFVSAVTHELRTPLTTFKMYSEMLADNMVSGERRKEYLRTLCSEANRLGHLVENVLAYARLERGNVSGRADRVSLGQLLERSKERLVHRCQQADMALSADLDPATANTMVRVDVSAVEQILFNLVDNACKYAGPDADERCIHLEAAGGERLAMIRVRDHGKGISPESARRLFEPFGKSAREAAHSAPGVGLGLALCRRLSRSLGGDLHLDPSCPRGACFVLQLPLAVPA